MIEPKSDRPRSPLSLAEEKVLLALETLPPEYEVTRGTRLQFRSGQVEDFPVSYEPDFEVCGPGGYRVVVEVKSDPSLSLVNLSRFVRINELIRAAGNGFLLLVWGGDRLGTRATTMPEFGALHIRPVKTESDVVQAVRNEFAATVQVRGN